MNRAERAAMSRLIDAFGADVLVNLTPPPSRTARERATIRAGVTGQTEACQACGLCDMQVPGDEKGPDFPSLTAPYDLTVLSPFPSSGAMHRMIRQAVSDHVNLTRVAWVPMTGCVPRAEGGTLRAASEYERMACRANLHASLDAAGAPNVLIIGEKAMRAWRPDLKLGQVRGIVGTWRNSYMVTVVEHPSNATTTGEKQEWRRQASRAVHRLLGEDVGGIGERCIAKGCERGFHAWDQDALPWCAEHLSPRALDRVPDYVNVRLPFGEVG
jgi:hypothetical protein